MVAMGELHCELPNKSFHISGQLVEETLCFVLIGW